jgi:Ser/Thr protein kinase RdoA (MazF antagonist)
MEPFSNSTYRTQVARLRRLAAEALDAYDIRVARLSLLAHLENTTFRVDAADGARYVLRIHRATGDPFHPVRSPAEVASEMVWLAALRRDVGEIGPLPVLTREASVLTVAATELVDEPRICVLMRWVPGRFLDAGLTPGHLAEVGRLMGRLHTQAASFSPPPGFVRPHVDPPSNEASAHAVEVIGRFRGRAGAEVVATVLDRVTAAGEALGRAPESSSLIHGDIHQENYLFSRGQPRLIDFDDSGWGHLLSDFAVTISELGSRPDVDELRRALLAGYGEVLPPPEGFDTLLPAFVALRQLKIILWTIEHRNHPDFAEWKEWVGEGLDHLRAQTRR